MGQLIKLQDYVSRYEQDIYLYPSRFVRLKKQHWEKLKMAWENNDHAIFSPSVELQTKNNEWHTEEKQPFISKIKGFLKPGKQEEEEDSAPQKTAIEETGEEELFKFETNFSYRPDTVEDLKYQFLDQLFRFQMKWASSTILEKSFVEKKFYYDTRLKYFLQRFPDTYLVLFKPLFLLKKAPIELETMMIGPTGIWCVSFLEEEDMSVFLGSKEKFWVKRGKTEEKRVLNPLLALNRTGKIAQQILKLEGIDFPVYKLLISRNGYIDFPSSPYDIQIIEKRNYEEWFSNMRKLRSPLKHVQLKGAKALLQHCQTTSIRRPDWD